VTRLKTRPLFWLAAGALAIALAAVALGAVLANEGGSGDSASTGPGPTATPRLIDPDNRSGQPTATSGPGIAPGEPTPPPRPDQPTTNRDTPTRPAPSPTRVPGGSQVPGTMRVLAPIETAQVAILESFPPQYRLQVKAGLPSGCARADGYEVTKSGNDVRVAVYNTLPTGNIACTAIYGIYGLSIDLGGGFVSGQEYRVNVNGTMVTFKAQ